MTEPTPCSLSQVVENQQLFGALKSLLEDLRTELREDEHARRRLQQQYASDKAAWDVEWAALKCRLEQVPARGGPPCSRCGASVIWARWGEDTVDKSAVMVDQRARTGGRGGEPGIAACSLARSF